jgi:hypothetical protein
MTQNPPSKVLPKFFSLTLTPNMHQLALTMKSKVLPQRHHWKIQALHCHSSVFFVASFLDPRVAPLLGDMMTPDDYNMLESNVIDFLVTKIKANAKLFNKNSHKQPSASSAPATQPPKNDLKHSQLKDLLPTFACIRTHQELITLPSTYPQCSCPTTGQQRSSPTMVHGLLTTTATH